MAFSDVGPQRVVPWVSAFFSTLGPVRTYPLRLPGVSSPDAVFSTVPVPMGVIEVGFPTAAIVRRWGVPLSNMRDAWPTAAPPVAQCAGKQERAAGAGASGGDLRPLNASDEYEYDQLLAAIPTMADAPVAKALKVSRFSPAQRLALLRIATAQNKKGNRPDLVWPRLAHALTVMRASRWPLEEQYLLLTELAECGVPFLSAFKNLEEGLAGVGIRRLTYPQRRGILVSLAVEHQMEVIQAYGRLRDEYEKFDLSRGLRRRGWGRPQRVYIEAELAQRGRLLGAGALFRELLGALRRHGWDPQLQYQLSLLLIAHTSDVVAWIERCALPILHSMQRVGWSPKRQYEALEHLATIPIDNRWLMADNCPLPAFQFAEPEYCDPGRLVYALAVLQPLAEAKVAAYRERQVRRAERHAARQLRQITLGDTVENIFDGFAKMVGPDEANTDSVPDALWHLFTRLATASRESLWVATAWLGAAVERGVSLDTAHGFLMQLLQNLSDNERPVALRLLQEHSHVFVPALSDPTADLKTLFALFDRRGGTALHAMQRSLTAWRLARIRALPPGPAPVYPPLDPEREALLRHVRGDDESGEE